MTIDCIGAIDQGTQSSRFIIYDARGAVVASHQEEFPQHTPHAGYAQRCIWRAKVRATFDASSGTLPNH
jgi:glycerol kinase